ILLTQIQQPASRQKQIEVLAKYFRTGAFIKPAWVTVIPALKDPGYDTQLADNAVKNLISSLYGEEQFGENLPWFDEGKKVRTIARFPHFDFLAPAYFHTGNEVYARTLIRHMVDFTKNAPIRLAKNINIQTDYTINPWNWVLQHWRIMRWIDTLGFLKDSPSLADSAYLRILLHLWQEVDWLVPRINLGLHNGTLGNLRAVLYASLNFPEVKNADGWFSEALGLFRSFIGTYFYPGEVSVELTLGYSSAVLAQCLKIYRALPASTMKDNIGDALEKLVDGHVGLMKPDRSLPRYGDHGNYDLRIDLLEKAGRLFNRPDLLSLTIENSNHPNPPYLSFPTQSRPYYLSGYYAMRDGWGKNAQYLCMDSGPFGTNHQHADKLSITVSADGANFIVDPGTSIYNSTQPGPRYDLRFGFLHNSITIDGIDQNAGWDQHYQFDVLDNRWVTNPVYDFIEGSYDFRSSGLDIIHKRSIFYKRGEYWLLLDALQGSGTYNLESNFQFMFDIDLKINQDRITAHASGGAELGIASVVDGLNPTVIMGDTTSARTQFPVRYPNIDHVTGGRGWVGVFGTHTPYDPNHSHAAPAVVFSGKVTLPHTSLRVLSPSKNKKAKPVHVSWLDRQANHIRVRIDHPDAGKGTYDIFDLKPNPKLSNRIRPGDESGWWLRGVEGTLTEIIFLNKDEIEYESGDSRVKLKLSEPAEGYLARKDKGWHLYIDKYIQKPIMMLEFQNVLNGSTNEIYIKDEQSNLLLYNETGNSVSELIPGHPYRLTQN
ncbi:MAG: alginate lyase family protein, partial [Verrucomicrobia bacterium]|nr:alginate lyase family protein [Verrucomicrobiota bacterium]